MYFRCQSVDDWYLSVKGVLHWKHTCMSFCHSSELHIALNGFIVINELKKLRRLSSIVFTDYCAGVFAPGCFVFSRTWFDECQRLSCFMVHDVMK